MSTATASLASPMPDRPRSRGPTAATDCLPSTVCLRAARPEGLPPRRTTTRTRHHRRHRHLWQATRTRLSGARTVTAPRSTVLRFRPRTCLVGDLCPASFAALCSCLSLHHLRMHLYLGPRRTVSKISLFRVLRSFSCVCSTIPRASTCIPRLPSRHSDIDPFRGFYAPRKAR
jgi:hypothetical protein